MLFLVYFIYRMKSKYDTAFIKIIVKKDRTFILRILSKLITTLTIPLDHITRPVHSIKYILLYKTYIVLYHRLSMTNYLRNVMFNVNMVLYENYLKCMLLEILA